MDERAVVRNEGRIDCPWFVYIENSGPQGATMAARFRRRAGAEKVARAINAALAAEGRHLPDRVYPEQEEL